jgi:hypothetical protein
MDQEKLEKIEKEVIRIKNSMGLIGGTARLRWLKDSRPNIFGRMDPKTYDIEIKVNKNWNPMENKKIANYIQKKGISDSIEHAIADVTRHEVNHWKKCPYDLTRHLEIIDSVAEVFEKAGKTAFIKTRDGKEVPSKEVKYVVNAFEDVIVNANVRAENKEAGNGTVIFFKDQKSYTPFYEAFVKLNIKIWGDDIDADLLDMKSKGIKEWIKNLFKRKSNVDKTVDRILSAWGCSSDLEKNLRKLNDMNKWTKLAKIFAKEMLPLLDKSSQCKENKEENNDSKQSSESESSQSEECSTKQQNNEKNENSGNKKEEEQKHGKNKENNQNDYSNDEGDKGLPSTSPGSNPFDEMMKDDEAMRKAITAMIGKGAGKAGLPRSIDPFLKLDVIYEQISPEIKIKVKENKEGYNLPLINYGIEPFDPEKHEINQLRLNKLLLDKNGNVTFGASRWKYPINVPVTECLRKFPNLCFIVDTSGSMMGGGDHSLIPWGDASGYHYALLGVYGIIKWLKAKGIAPYINYTALNFSNRTFGDSASFDEIWKLKKILLSPQSGGTEIDMNVIENILAGKDPTIVILLSDGAIYNWGCIEERFMEIMKNHYPALIQIGPETYTAQSFKQYGYSVSCVNKYEDLPNIMIDVTMRAFGDKKDTV